MSSYINRSTEYDNVGAGNGDIVPLNRWSSSNYTVAAAGGAFDVSFEGTLTKLNRVDDNNDPPATINWFPIASSQLTAAGAVNILDTPLEAIRPVFASQSGITTVEIMQQGSND